MDSVFDLLSAYIFAVIHHLILQKILKQQFPLSNLIRSPRISDGRKTAIAYGVLISLSFLLLALIGILFLIGFLPPQPQLAEFLAPLEKKGIGIDFLIMVIIFTVILLMFSKKFLGKPLKETWKAILLAGLVAGTISTAASFALKKYVGPYLHVNRTVEKQVGE